jgi:flavodoxin short chain
MAKILIVYGSTTGNTEWVAGELAKQFKAAGHEVNSKKAGDVQAAGLCQGYDLAAFGSSTWGQDEIELQEDFAALFEAFDQIGASGVKTAVFGCGDQDYTFFCGAVDAIADKLKALGSSVVGDKLKINADPGDSAAAIKAWGENILEAL